MSTVFDAFSAAIVTDKWQIGKLQRATEIGDVFSDPVDLNVIEDLSQSLVSGNANDADGLKTETLLYVKPSELPTIDPATLMASYLLKDTSHNRYFKIASAAVAKNQHSGSVEHIEFVITETEALV